MKHTRTFAGNKIFTSWMHDSYFCSNLLIPGALSRCRLSRISRESCGAGRCPQSPPGYRGKGMLPKWRRPLPGGRFPDTPPYTFCFFFGHRKHFQALATFCPKSRFLYRGLRVCVLPCATAVAFRSVDLHTKRWLLHTGRWLLHTRRRLLHTNCWLLHTRRRLLHTKRWLLHTRRRLAH